MRFDIISIFPESFQSYFGVSILKRAQEEKLIDVRLHDLREYTHDRRQTVDDTPYGGGAGMVLKIEPIDECVQSVISNFQFPISNNESKTRIILFSAKGRTFTQKDARRLVEYDRIIMICGRYEGVDERVAEHLIDEELSIGEYVLTGGELPAMVVADAVTRLLPGVLGNDESSEQESHTEEGITEYPQYTKPEEYRGWKVPDVLLSGHHGEIAKWRKEQQKQVE